MRRDAFVLFMLPQSMSILVDCITKLMDYGFSIYNPCVSSGLYYEDVGLWFCIYNPYAYHRVVFRRLWLCLAGSIPANCVLEVTATAGRSSRVAGETSASGRMTSREASASAASARLRFRYHPVRDSLAEESRIMMCTRIIESLDRYLGSLGRLCGFMPRYQRNEGKCTENSAYCEG